MGSEGAALAGLAAFGVGGQDQNLPPDKNQGPLLDRVVWVNLAISGVFLVARLWTKWRKTHRLYWDDGLIVLAWVGYQQDNTTLHILNHGVAGRSCPRNPDYNGRHSRPRPPHAIPFYGSAGANHQTRRPITTQQFPEPHDWTHSLPRHGLLPSRHRQAGQAMARHSFCSWTAPGAWQLRIPAEGSQGGKVGADIFQVNVSAIIVFYTWV